MRTRIIVLEEGVPLSLRMVSGLSATTLFFRAKVILRTLGPQISWPQMG
jgi:hypothetical protein